MGQKKIISLIFFMLIFTASTATASVMDDEYRYVNWKEYIAIGYGTSFCIDENTYYKMLEPKSGRFDKFTDQELDWARTNIGYCTPNPGFFISTEIQFVNENINFTGWGSGGGNHTIVSHKWDFGDGTIETGTGLLKSNTWGVTYNCKAIHSYSSEGNYTVKLTVTNDQGHTNWVTEIVEIINDVEAKSVTQSDLEYKYGETWSFDKYKKGDFTILGRTQKGLGKPQVGEIAIIKGSEYVYLRKYTEDGSTKTWDIPVLNDPICVRIYKNDLQVFYDVVYTNSNGEFTCHFIPEEAGYHKLVVVYPPHNTDDILYWSGQNWDYKWDKWYDEVFYVSEKTDQSSSSGFEAIFAIVGVLIIVYFLRRSK